jgi:guanosine-3',5'-bis(diphosphate) 3'-pyrophosphohydrolase
MNLRDLTDNPPSDWSIERITGYFDWAEKVVLGLRGLNQKLDDMFDEALAIARAKYEVKVR